MAAPDRKRLIVVWLAAAAAAFAEPAEPPALVVVVVCEQLSASTLNWLQPQLPPATADQPGGLRYFFDHGAWFLNARPRHLFASPAAAAATIATGTEPQANGIVADAWYDREQQQLVPATAPALRLPTLTDIMVSSSGGKARVVSIGWRRDVSSLLGATTSIWVGNDGHWQSPGALPKWLTARRQALNDWSGKRWTRAGKREAANLFDQVRQADRLPTVFGTAFPHDLPVFRDLAPYLAAIAMTPYADRYILEAAAACLQPDQLPDLLYVSLTARARLGQHFHPRSAESAELLLQFDRRLADLLHAVGDAVPGGLDRCLVVLAAATADRGQLPPHQYLDRQVLADAADKHLDSYHGTHDWVVANRPPHIYLDRRAAVPRALGLPKVSAAAAAAIAELPGVYLAATREQILEGRLPQLQLTALLTAGYDPERAGDILVVPRPGWVFDDGDEMTTDQQPLALLLAGPGVRPGRYTEAVSPAQLAATIAHLLAISAPPGSADILPGITR